MQLATYNSQYEIHTLQITIYTTLPHLKITGGYAITISHPLSMDDITVKDIEIILALQQSPFATYEDLALATAIPKTTVYEITKKLDSAFSVLALPNLPKLGLETIDVFLEADKDFKIQYLEKFAYTHPYIAYFARIFGMYSGIYYQFKIPLGTVGLIQNLLQIMKNSGQIDRFTLLHFTSPPIYSTFDLHAWNPANLSWKFSWKQWFALPLGDSEISGDKPSTSTTSTDSDVKSWLQKRDIAIINQLSISARRSNTKIREGLLANWTINDSTLSRRLKLIKRECISSYKVQIDPRIFDLVNTILIWGYGSAPNIQQISQRMHSNPIPFLSTLKTENYSFYWYIHLPTYHMSDLLYFLRQFMDELHLFYVDYPRAKRFSIDDDTFDEAKKNWITEPAFLIDDVLAKLSE